MLSEFSGLWSLFFFYFLLWQGCFADVEHIFDLGKEYVIDRFPNQVAYSSLSLNISSLSFIPQSLKIKIHPVLLKCVVENSQKQ